MLSDNALWQRIREHPIDDPTSQFPISARLARENGWDDAFTQRVIEEYRRFCYLGQVAGHEVTPSDEVDQAWHLHLIYTRDYWDSFCPNALGSKFHHGPTKGGAEESQRYTNNYEQTLESYRREFDAEPPADIWPSAEFRFGEALHFRRINLIYFSVKKRDRPRLKKDMIGCGSFVFIIFVGILSLILLSKLLRW